MPLQINRSSVAGHVPPSLAFGQLSINTADGILFYGDATGAVHQMPLSVAKILANSALTGTPTAPTAPPGTSTTQLATTAFVAAALNALLNGAPGALDTLKELADAINDDANFAGTVTTGLGNRLRLDTNGNYTAAQKALARFNSGSAHYEAVARDNLVVNPRHVISQANGASAVTSTGYVTDGHMLGLSGIAAQAQQGGAAFASRPDLTNSLAVTINTAKSSLAAGDYLLLSTPIEGTRTQYLRFGTSTAINLAICFTARSNVAGTYYAHVRNAAGTRVYPVKFTLQANVDTFVSFVVPGDTVGTWATDSTVGLYLGICLAAGSNYNGAAANTWSGGSLSPPDCGNLAAAAGNVFSVSDLIVLPSLSVPADLTTLFPQERLPLFRRTDMEEMALCERYYEVVQVPLIQSPTAAGSMATPSMFKNRKRAKPTLTVLTAPTLTNVSAYTAIGSTVDGFSNQITATAPGGSASGGVLVADARL